MSEHEGVGKPLIESMLSQLPVLAFCCDGVAETMGNAGVLFMEKRYPELAELALKMCQDEAWRGRMIGRQSTRVEFFLERNAKQIFLQGLGYE